MTKTILKIHKVLIYISKSFPTTDEIQNFSLDRYQGNKEKIFTPHTSGVLAERIGNQPTRIVLYGISVMALLYVCCGEDFQTQFSFWGLQTLSDLTENLLNGNEF